MDTDKTVFTRPLCFYQLPTLMWLPGCDYLDDIMLSLSPRCLFPEWLWSVHRHPLGRTGWGQKPSFAVWQRQIKILCGIMQMYWGQGSGGYILKYVYMIFYSSGFLHCYGWREITGWPVNLQVPPLSSKLKYEGTFFFIRYVLVHSSSCVYEGLTFFLSLLGALEVWRGGCST